MLRFACAPRKLHFLFGFMNLIDLAAILPYYVTSFVSIFMDDEAFSHSSSELYAPIASLTSTVPCTNTNRYFVQKFN